MIFDPSMEPSVAVRPEGPYLSFLAQLIDKQPLNDQYQHLDSLACHHWRFYLHRAQKLEHRGMVRIFVSKR